MTQSKSNAASPGPVGSNTWQTAISLLVFIHLFALFAAVVGNFGPVSPLRGRLGAVPLLRPYLEFLDMDLAYNYHLVDASEFDAPLAVEP